MQESGPKRLITLFSEAENLLRDSHGIVAEILAFVPPRNLQFIG